MAPGPRRLLGMARRLRTLTLVSRQTYVDVIFLFLVPLLTV